MDRVAKSYAPLIEERDGKTTVTLSEDHPGFGDRRYIEHRERIAAAALHARTGDPVPYIMYSEEDDATWQLVTTSLSKLHKQYAAAEYLAHFDALNLPSDRAPQLRDVSDTIGELTGFKMTPAAGIVGTTTFYGELANRTFNATQYIRHPSQPRFSPEPDMIHEIIGHGAHLANERWARMYELVGKAVLRLSNPKAVQLVSRVFWFSMECGVVEEKGELKVWGASLLTSAGEMAQFRNVDIRELDLAGMAKQGYEPDAYQPVLYKARSLGHFEDFLEDFLTMIDDDTPDAI
ncbi:phenylalanine 4-monooxygenase [Streptomyces sp. NPDC093250]|uniref:phenylalanine 4-monooxygenase n=1 Tax=Streptomyces sp. NPDC093250 TaxID=3366036 RepID=UPI00380396A3